MTFVLIGLWRSGNSLLRNVLIKKGRRTALQALFSVRRGPLPARKLLREFRSLGLPLLIFLALQVDRMRGEGLRVHLVLCPGRLPPFPLDLGLARGRGVSLNVRLLSASAPPPLQLIRELERWGLLGRSGLPLLAPLPRLFLPVPLCTFHDAGN